MLARFTVALGPLLKCHSALAHARAPPLRGSEARSTRSGSRTACS
jgi:hypothetical protein